MYHTVVISFILRFTICSVLAAHIVYMEYPRNLGQQNGFLWLQHGSSLFSRYGFGAIAFFLRFQLHSGGCWHVFSFFDLKKIILFDFSLSSVSNPPTSSVNLQCMNETPPLLSTVLVIIASLPWTTSFHFHSYSPVSTVEAK